MQKVSIVTISFNQAEFLERTILSVLGQDYSNIEYIVVDAGSTDGSRKLIDKYQSRIATRVFEPDHGAADGLNKGFARATGDIFGFLNSDDVLYPGAVSAAVKHLIKFPRIDVVSGHAKIIGPDDRVLRLTYSDRMSVRRAVYGGVVLVQPSTFFRRFAFEKTAGFNTANRATWDGELFLEMALAGCKFGVSSDIWSGYRLHKESITLSKRLTDVMVESLDRRFYRVMGRHLNRSDRGLQWIYRALKHLSNPRDTIQRITRGPTFGRELD